MKLFYLLVHKDTNKTFVLKLPRKHFSFIVNEYYFFLEKNEEELTLEEKTLLTKSFRKYNLEKNITS